MVPIIRLWSTSLSWKKWNWYLDLFSCWNSCVLFSPWKFCSKVGNISFSLDLFNIFVAIASVHMLCITLDVFGKRKYSQYLSTCNERMNYMWWRWTFWTEWYSFVVFRYSLVFLNLQFVDWYWFSISKSWMDWTTVCASLFVVPCQEIQMWRWEWLRNGQVL